MKKVFIYSRVSTSEQLGGGGHDRQIEACQKFCEFHKWEVLREFKEQITGSTDAMDRPQLSEAISLCGAAYDVYTIVVERSDRIARDLIVGELFFTECRERKIEVYSVDSSEELVNAESDPTRKLIRQVLGALSEWSKNEIAKKLLAGRKRTKELTGLPCGGRPVFGTTPEQIPWVWRILRWHRAGCTIPEILSKLNNCIPFRNKDFRIRPRWYNGQVSKVINTWNHRAEFSKEKMNQIILDDAQRNVIFP